jgi:NNP family nitrate/nitrite transporter-like MFS transporter
VSKHATRSYLALVLATLAFTLCMAVWGLIGALAPLFRARYGLTATEVGLLVAIPILLGALARLLLGLLTDRYGGRATFTLLLLALMVPVGLAGLARSYGELLLVGVPLGLAGAAFSVGVPFVARWFPPTQQGAALGIYGMGNGGIAVASLVAPPLAERLGTSAAFWAWLPVLLAGAILVILVGRDAPGFVGRHESLGARLAVLQRRPIAWVLALFYFVTFGGFVAIAAYKPTLLVTTYGLSPADAGVQTAIFITLTILARPVGGYLADRLGGTPVLNGVFVVAAGLAVVLAFQPGMPVLTVVFLTMAVALGLGSSAVLKLVAERFPRETGTVTGLVGAAGGLGGFFPPLLLGLVKDATGSYAIAFMLLSEVALGCLLLNILVLERRAALLLADSESGGLVADGEQAC